MAIENVGNMRYGCKIRLHRQDHYGSDAETKLYWTGLRFHLFTKYVWYFRYRAALLQIAHPRQYVELANFQYDYVPTEEEEHKRANDKLIAKKAKLTTWLNKVEAYKKGWNSLFPVETDASYQLAVAKIEKLKAELTTMQDTGKLSQNKP